VLATYFGTIVSAGIAEQEDGQFIGKRLAEWSAEFDIDLFVAE
jgi:hypothetical protein